MTLVVFVFNIYCYSTILWASTYQQFNREKQISQRNDVALDGCVGSRRWCGARGGCFGHDRGSALAARCSL